VPNNQFLITPDEFKAKFAKPPVMEVFYRYMRTSRNILLDEHKKPVGGKWNFDAENRSFDKNHMPSWEWAPSQNEYVMMAKEYFSASNILIDFPTTRKDALDLLEYFVANHLQDFGRLEDAMYQEDGKIHHSYLSIALNFGLLHPREVIDRVLSCDVPLSSKE
jgi:deoxyribodipyrimidine photolyase-related protein